MPRIASSDGTREKRDSRDESMKGSTEFGLTRIHNNITSDFAPIEIELCHSSYDGNAVRFLKSRNIKENSDEGFLLFDVSMEGKPRPRKAEVVVVVVVVVLR